MHINFSPSQTKNECRLHFLHVEDEDKGAWTCRIRYENSDGESILYTLKSWNDSYPALSTLYNNSQKPSSVDKSLIQGSSMDRLSTNKSIQDGKSLMQSGGPSIEKLSSTKVEGSSLENLKIRYKSGVFFI